MYSWKQLSMCQLPRVPISAIQTGIVFEFLWLYNISEQRQILLAICLIHNMLAVTWSIRLSVLYQSSLCIAQIMLNNPLQSLLIVPLRPTLITNFWKDIIRHRVSFSSSILFILFQLWMKLNKVDKYFQPEQDECRLWWVMRFQQK